MIPHSRPTIGAAERDAVAATIDDNWIGPGPRTKALQEALGQATGASLVSLTLSGTQALVWALRSIGLPAGAPVAFPEITCTEVPTAIVAAGLTPLVCAVDPQRLTLDPGKVPETVRAIVAPHAWGASVDADALDALGLPWIEDCATSPAVIMNGHPAGSRGHASIFSFGATKYLTAGIGGALCVRDAAMADRLATIRAEEDAPQGLGDLNAAMACVQWSRMAEFRHRRAEIGRRFDATLAATPLEPRPLAPGDALFRYIVRTAGPATEMASRLRAAGVDARTSVNPWFPLHPGEPQCPSVARLHWDDRLLSLPFYPGLTETELSRIVDVLAQTATAALP